MMTSNPPTLMTENNTCVRAARRTLRTLTMATLTAKTQIKNLIENHTSRLPNMGRLRIHTFLIRTNNNCRRQFRPSLGPLALVQSCAGNILSHCQTFNELSSRSNNNSTDPDKQKRWKVPEGFVEVDIGSTRPGQEKSKFRHHQRSYRKLGQINQV